jgi:uncharacterized membrane protein
MHVTVKASLLALSIAYPFLVYWGIQHDSRSWLLLLLAGLLLLRWLTASSSQERYVMVVLMAIVSAVVAWMGAENGLKLYPVIINLSLLALFVSSLFSAMPVVERMARLREPDLSSPAVHYTRRVTQVWCVFFSLNAMISLITVLLADDVIWLWYNGVIAYILMAGLMGGEWLFRQRARAL